MATLAGLTGVASVVLAACSQTSPPGAEAIDQYSDVGDCLRPDTGRSQGFLQADCDDPEATVEIIEMVGALGLESPPLCPPGTDLLVNGEQGPLVDGDIAAVPETWCLRNLEPPHPGDPGQGGGELVPGDCFAIAENGEITEVPCTGGSARPEHRLLANERTAEACPAETADPIELNAIPPRVLCAVDA